MFWIKSLLFILICFFLSLFLLGFSFFCIIIFFGRKKNTNPLYLDIDKTYDEKRDKNKTKMKING
jgi:hypothetical protein